MPPGHHTPCGLLCVPVLLLPSRAQVRGRWGAQSTTPPWPARRSAQPASTSIAPAVSATATRTSRARQPPPTTRSAPSSAARWAFFTPVGRRLGASVQPLAGVALGSCSSCTQHVGLHLTIIFIVESSERLFLLDSSLS